MTAACGFFDAQMSDMPGMAKLIQTQYCRKEFAGCARFFVASALGMGSVPDSLFPGHMEKAAQLLEEGA